jgi:hypothetical protein
MGALAKRAKIPGNTRGRSGVHNALCRYLDFMLQGENSWGNLHRSKARLTSPSQSPIAMYAQRPTPNAYWLRASSFRALVILGAMSAHSAFSQGDFIPLDHKGEPPSGHSGYMANKGQLTAMQGGAVPDVLYYSIQAWPQMFFTNKNEVFFQLGARDSSLSTPDTIYRVGMKFIGPNVNLECVPSTYEQLADYWNFILGHLAQPLMGQHAYRRIVYPDVYPNIDFHAYSNPWGPKFYFVMRPGSNPADLKLQFSGQDSLILDAYDQLKAYAGGLSVVLPKGLSYQEIGGTTMLVDAQVEYELFPGEISVGFVPSSYDPAYPLIIDISASFGAMGGGPAMLPEWCTYYGHTETDVANEGALTLAGGLVVCGSTTSPQFPLQNAQFGVFNGGSDAYYSEFDENYHRTYTTLFGGNAADIAHSVALSTDESVVYIYGRSYSTDLPVPAAGASFNDNTNTASDCFIARFSRTSVPFGLQDWGTFFGSHTRECECIRVDINDHIHISGSAGASNPLVTEATCQGTDGTFPTCAAIGPQAYAQQEPGGQEEGFYARFDSNLNLIHSTLIGGSGIDDATYLAIDNSLGGVYVVGSTTSPGSSSPPCSSPDPGEFPLCHVAGGYFQSGTQAFSPDAYILCLDGSGSVIWSTKFGSNTNDWANRVGININGDVYVSGYTTALDYALNSCAPPVGSGFPSCASGQQAQYTNYSPSGDYFIAKFDRETRQLIWSTYIRGQVYSMLPDEGGNMIISLTTGTLPNSTDYIPILQRPNTYFQPFPEDAGIPSGEGVILGFNMADVLMLGTYFGGYGQDWSRMALPWSGGRLYILGNSFSNTLFPFSCPPTADPYCYLTYATQTSTTGEAFYAQLQYDLTIGLEEGSAAAASPQDCVLSPNPSTGDVSLFFGTSWISAERATIEVIDPSGRVVRAWEARPTGTPLTLPLSDVAKGVYVVRVTDGAFLNKSQRLIVQ